MQYSYLRVQHTRLSYAIMANKQTSIRPTTRIKWFFKRFRNLPSIFWIKLGAIFGVADFLTWSVLDKVEPTHRFRWTMFFVVLAGVVAILEALRNPSVDERLSKARNLHIRAQKAYESGEYLLATEILSQVVQLDPGSVPSWGLLGRCQMRLGDFRKAVESLTIAIPRSTKSKAKLLHNRGVAFALSGQYGRALDDFSDRLVINDNPVTRRWRALIWLYLDRHDNALNDINKALDTRPRYLCGIATKAAILYSYGDSVAGQNVLDQCERIIPQDADEFYCLALAYSQAQCIDLCIKMLRIAIEQDPKYRVRSKTEPLFGEEILESISLRN